MLKLNARITVTGGAGRATATIGTTEANLVPALRLAVEMLREPAFPDAEFDQVKKQRVAGIENNRTDPAALAPLALNRAMNPFPRGDVRYVRHHRRADRGRQQGDAGRRAEVSRAVLRRLARRDRRRRAVQGSRGAGRGGGAARRAGRSPAPYARIATPYQKTPPVNLKIETPDKQNATFDAALKLRDVRHRS